LIASDTKAVLFAAGLMFLYALVLGVLKFRQVAASPQGQAHPYIDTAHRAALMYSFAIGLTATFVQFSGFPQAVDLAAAGALIVFFVAAVVGYNVQGLRGQTANQFRDGEGPPGLHGFMWALIAAEIGGLLVLLAGFVTGSSSSCEPSADGIVLQPGSRGRPGHRRGPRHGQHAGVRARRGDRGF